MITAKVLADSKNKFDNRITTMIVTMPRYILAEFNTHRMFSRNSASSRAIPFEKMVKSVEENPYIPIAWMKDHKGMQGSEYFTDPAIISILEANHLTARNDAISSALFANVNGLTKQIINRYLEPFMWHTVIVTATEWENFFALRCPKYLRIGEGGTGSNLEFRSRKDFMNYDESRVTPKIPLTFSEIGWLSINKGQADIHMMALAEAMWDAYNESAPKELKAGEWHIPFGDNFNEDNIYQAVKDRNLRGEYEYPEYGYKYDEIKIKIATARCARVSYTVIGEEDKPDNYEADIKLHDRLAASGHWSPMEHCAKAMNEEEYTNYKPDGKVSKEYFSNGWSGNFRGFIQYRKTFTNENIKI